MERHKTLKTKRISKPDFLIIGGMKCGSTTLYNDLRKHPRVHFPGKETSFFSDTSSVNPVEQKNYVDLFDPELVSGDCSTRYSMLPTHSGVAERARKLLRDDVRLVYMVRNPIERCISHHHHLQARDATKLGFDEAIEEFPEIIEYSRYDIQLSPWLEQFGENTLKVVPIEDYNANWRFNIESLAAHLQIDADGFRGTEADHANKTEEARVLTGIYRRIYDSNVFKTVYLNGVKTLLPEKLRNYCRHVLLPKPPPRDPMPSEHTLRMLANVLEPAVSAVSELNGRCDWNLEATVKKLSHRA